MRIAGTTQQDFFVKNVLLKKYMPRRFPKTYTRNYMHLARSWDTIASLDQKYIFLLVLKSTG
jgi:hypothetical protein